MDKEVLTFIFIGTQNSGLWMTGELVRQAGHEVHMLCPAYPNKVEGLKVNLSDVDVVVVDDEIWAERGRAIAEMGIVYWPTSTLLTWLMSRLKVDPRSLFDEKVHRKEARRWRWVDWIWRRKNVR